ncbi:MAG: homocysteine S-methyltransferase family protein, partial [Pseudomonadota bacterium]|nr:homocysteine S-methyltransferase family protein [Pseudomonadota bacterium]
MSRAAFLDLLATRPWLLADGATGTNYFDAGLASGDAPELWNFDHSDRVRSLHGQFIAAGADIILTNTFGGNRYRLKLHDAHTRVREINMA